MLKLLSLIAALHGRTPTATRVAANEYRLDNGVTLRTNGCTVTAERTHVRLYREPRLGRPWMTFLDDHGRYDADCEVIGVAQ